MSGVFKQPGVRVQMPRHNEGSILRSPRDEDALGRQWVKSRATTDQTAAMAEQVKQLQWQLNRLRKKQPMTPYQRLLMPFEIYRSPDDPNGAAADQKYKFRVHSGKIGTVPNTSVPAAMRYVTGTDGQADVTYLGSTYKLDDVRDESAEVPAYDGTNIDFTVDTGEWTWVWVDNTDVYAPVIAYGMALPDAWSVFSTDYVLIGAIDATSADSIYIKQYVRQDIMFQSAGGGTGGTSVRMYTFVSWHEEYITCYYPGLQLTAVHRESGGTGYTANDVVSFSVSGEDLPVAIKITTVDGSGVPTALTILDGGQFAAEPANPDALAAVGGTGTGLVLHGTFGANTTPVYVALQPELRESYNPASLSVTYPDPPDQTRVVAIDESTNEDQVIQPKLYAGDLVPVWECLNTGVVDPGDPLVALTLLMATGREWAKVYEPPA